MKEAVKSLLNDSVNAQIDFETVDLSLLSSFPHANVTVGNLKIVNQKAFKGDTLCSVHSISFDLPIKELFKKQEDLIADKIRQFSTFNIDFTPQIELLQNQFLYLHELAKQTDKSFSGAVSAQEKKQLKGLINLEKRLLKAQKRKLNHLTSRIIDLQNELFPRENLQERQLNFSELYMLFGTQLIEQLVLNLQPLKKDFLILEM